VFETKIALNEHAKKCVFGVFLKYTRITLIAKNKPLNYIAK